MISGNKDTFDTYLKTKSTGLINSSANNTYMTVEIFKIG